MYVRICILSPVYPHPNPGVYVGIERNVYELASAHQEKNHDVEVLTTFWNGGEAEDLHNGIRIHRVMDTSKIFGRIGRLLDAHFLSFSLSLYNKKRIFDRCDILHSFMPIANAGWISQSTPLVTTFQHFEKISNLMDLLYLPIHRWVENHTYSISDCVVVPSHASRNDLLSKFNVPSDNVELIPHGVNIDVFKPIESVNSDQFRVLFAGPLVPRKNVPVLIKAISKAAESIPKIELHIAGDGPERTNIENVAESFGVINQTTFHGYCNDEQLLHLYRSSDVFAFPSIQEGFGMVMIEAMACGTPVIAPNDSPFKEVIENTGILVPRSSKAFANAIVKLYNDRSLLDDLRLKSINRVHELYDWNEISESYIELYKKLESNC